MNQAGIQHHLSMDLLTRALDEELSPAERFEVEGHLAVCELCRQEMDSLSDLSLAIESVVASSALVSASDSAFRRRHLLVRLEPVADASQAAPSAGGVMKRFGWGMAIAATLAFGILLAPRSQMVSPSTPPVQVAADAPDSSALPTNIEVDGESFTPLPYSNPDLPINAAHVVQMQVPVSSLSDVGIVLEPVVSRVNRPDDASVLADVLVGSDGQPRGVHVLSTEF
jgi:hypothetical protein